MNQRIQLFFICFALLVTQLWAQGRIKPKNQPNQHFKIFAATENRIVGGSNVPLGQIPSHASLRTLANLHFCGGSIISISWIISAAHCTVNRAQNAINIVVGTVTLNAGGVTHRSAQIVQHPQYSSFTLANDVSLVRIETTFTLSAHIQTINLGIIVLGAGHNVDV